MVKSATFTENAGTTRLDHPLLMLPTIHRHKWCLIHSPRHYHPYILYRAGYASNIEPNSNQAPKDRVYVPICGDMPLTHYTPPRPPFDPTNHPTVT